MSVNVNHTIYTKVATSVQFKNPILSDISIQNWFVKNKKETFITPVILNFIRNITTIVLVIRLDQMYIYG